MKNLFNKLFLSHGVNYFSGDVPLQGILKQTSTVSDSRMESLGSYVSEELIEILYDIDRSSGPSLHQWGIEGDRIDYVRLSPAHRNALARVLESGTVGSIIPGGNSLMQHFLTAYIVSDAGLFCTMTLTAQTAYAIDKYGSEEAKRKFLHHFGDSPDSWFGATYYTEVQGGSDLGANSTIALKKGDKYYLTGEDKYFASNAGVADAAVVTARIDGSPKGAKGIAVFLVPAYREGRDSNYKIRRLKDKLGTIAVPTGEIELDNSEAYLLGSPREGIYIALEVLTISRIDDALAASGISRKALWESYLYARRRSAFGKKLSEHPLMKRDLMELEAETEASLALSMLAASRFDSSRSKRPPYDREYHLARLLANSAKNFASSVSADVTRYCMEILGGVGFLEEFPMAKFHRDALVTSIWEGTSNIQSLEFLEVLSKGGMAEAVLKDLSRDAEAVRSKALKTTFMHSLEDLESKIGRMLSSDAPEFYSKSALQDYSVLRASIALAIAGQEEDGPLAVSAEIFAGRHLNPEGIQSDTLTASVQQLGWMNH